MQNQKTINKTVSYSSIGLHTGDETTITFKPAPPDTGIVFIRVDLPDRPHIKADVAHVVDVSRGTTIGQGDIKILTVEHVLAAFAGLEIDNIFAEVDASEAPVGDGSASPFVEVLSQAGIREQDYPRREFKLVEPIAYEEDGKRGENTSNHPLRGHKGSEFDGGFRVPFYPATPVVAIALNLFLAADQRVYMALHGTLVEVGRKIFQRLVFSFASRLFPGFRLYLLGFVRDLGNAMGDVVDDIKTTDTLLVQQVYSL